MRTIEKALLLTALALYPSFGHAQQPAVTSTVSADALDRRATELVALLQGKTAVADYFTAAFLAAVPPAQLQTVIGQLTQQHGAAIELALVERTGANTAVVHIRFANSTGRFRLTIDPTEANRASGLLVSGFTGNNDSLTVIADEIRALPGKSNLLVTPLGGAMAPLVAHNADTALAIGSTFKLYILAELAAQAQHRKLGWDRVTEADRRSFSSKATEFWPANAPVTLHTLASWMISVSDNGATDILLDVLGRDAVGKRLTMIGNSVSERNLPFLNTVEAFALKSAANADLRIQFLAAREADQRRLLDSAGSRLTLDAISAEMFVGKPLHIDTIEWFASANDLVRLMDYFRLPAMVEARAIMAINPGIARDAAESWDYVGYKGGSEAGVISMSFLLRSKAGKWYAVTGSWNDVAAPVDNNKFIGLMGRLVEQLAKDTAVTP